MNRRSFLSVVIHAAIVIPTAPKPAFHPKTFTMGIDLASGSSWSGWADLSVGDKITFYGLSQTYQVTALL